MVRPKTDERMVKVTCYFSAQERAFLDQNKQDISRSLFVRRAVQKAIQDNDNDNVQNKDVLSGATQVTNQKPPSTAAIDEAVTTTTTTPKTPIQEVEGVV